MTCGCGYNTGSCVCNILKEIAAAQTDVVENSCFSSCDQAISDLLGDTDNGNGLDTVPFILYCKDGCGPFKGYGAHCNHIGNIMSSYYFRVKKVSDDCCAVIELLKDPHDECVDPGSPGEQKTKHLHVTGICVSVDLKCFCHVTCLPAISAF